MRPLILCRERLERILSILGRRGGALSMRDFFRTFAVFDWEIEQAESLGWVTITMKKPPSGRPSRIVEKVSKNECAKLPPRRCQIPSQISFRHWNFVFAYLSTSPPCNASAAYRASFRGARSAAGARASANRLLKHPDVRAALAWIRACSDGDLPAIEKLKHPASAHEIREIFERLGHWRKWQL